MYFSKRTLELAEALVSGARRAHLRLASAESCTGGLIAGALTEVPGSSDVFERGFVTYSNRAKQDLLGVPDDLLVRHGAVSEAVARAMAEGACTASGTDAAVSATGIAGPGGGTDTKPVGLVHIAAARRGRPTLHHAETFPGNREEVRAASVEGALGLLLEIVSK